MNKKLFELSYSVRKDFEKKISSVLFFVICIFVAINLFVAFVAFSVRIASGSMEPDSGKNTCILFSPLKRNVGRGSVVLLEPLQKSNDSFLFEAADCVVRFFTAQQFSIVSSRKNMGANRLVRRVIGVPGDTIYMRDYVMYIKPAGEDFFLTEFELVKKPYNVSINAAPSLWDSSLGVCGSFDQVTLGEDEYFVLGDYRNSCVDSRFFGTVEGKDIKAGALVSYFPLNKIRIYF